MALRVRDLGRAHALIAEAMDLHSGAIPCKTSADRRTRLRATILQLLIVVVRLRAATM